MVRFMLLFVLFCLFEWQRQHLKKANWVLVKSSLHDVHLSKLNLKDEPYYSFDFVPAFWSSFA